MSIPTLHHLAVTATLLLAPWGIRAADKPKLPEGPGKATTVRICGTCRAAELVMNRRETLEGWNAVVEDMIRRGTRGTDEEFGEIVDYLVTHFPKSAGSTGKVKVNSATAKELASGLGISEEQAAAVVQHRVSKGKFQSVDDLLKVQGIDTQAVESKKDKIEF